MYNTTLGLLSGEFVEYLDFHLDIQTRYIDFEEAWLSFTVKKRLLFRFSALNANK